MLNTANFLVADLKLLLLDEGDLRVRVRSLVKGNVLDDGDVVDTTRFLESREAKPMIDLLKPSQHKVLRAAFRQPGSQVTLERGARARAAAGGIWS